MDQEYLVSVLAYCAETGLLKWKERSAVHFSNNRHAKAWNSRFPGTVAGTADSYGYTQIGIDGKRYLAHRLAWLWMTGEWPNGQIDHINRCKSDNRFCNLRMATVSQNCANIGLTTKNKSGFKGVSWNKAVNKWSVNICVRQRIIRLGVYDDIEIAASIYACAAQKYFGEFARLS